MGSQAKELVAKFEEEFLSDVGSQAKKLVAKFDEEFLLSAKVRVHPDFVMANE